MHGDSAVALAGKTISEPEEGLFRGADQPGEILDLVDGKTGDFRGPLRRLRLQMRLKPGRIIGEARHVIAIRIPVTEGDVHHGAGERSVGAGADNEAHIRLFHGRIVVDIDHYDLRAALLAGFHRMGHDIDLRGDRVGAPDDDDIGLGDFAWIGATQCAGAHHVAGPGHVGADRSEEAGIFLGVAQPLNGIALHLPHGAGVEIGPDGFGTIPRFSLDESVRHLVQSRVPGNFLPVARALRALAALRGQQSAGMIDALGITRHLGADHAGGVSIGVGPAHAADPAIGIDVDLQRAGARTVMRANRVSDTDFGLRGGFFSGNRGRNVHVFCILHQRCGKKAEVTSIKNIHPDHSPRQAASETYP